MTFGIRGECSSCGMLLEGDGSDYDTFYVFLTIPGRGHFAKTMWQAELRCKNVMHCAERKSQESALNTPRNGSSDTLGG